MLAGQRGDRATLEDMEFCAVESPLDILRPAGSGVQVTHDLHKAQNLGLAQNGRFRKDRSALG